MATRHLFLVGYDIRDDKRRRKILRDVQGHTLNGQKSVYECHLTVAELNMLMGQLRSRIDPAEDKVIFVRIDRGEELLKLGSAASNPSAGLFETDYFLIT
jgi:CRISPR-associated protein Cas2